MRVEDRNLVGVPASFTRFVLPVPYELVRREAPDAARHWFDEATAEDWLHTPLAASSPATLSNPLPTHAALRDNPGGRAADDLDRDRRAWFERHLDQDRRDYFTRETEVVLYTRARWLVLRGAPLVNQFDLHRTVDGRLRRVRVHLQPPALVLFECPDARGAAGRQGILSQAMIVVETHLGVGDADSAEPDLDDLLVLNELFRYFLRPFERHARPPEDGGKSDHNYRRELAGAPVDWREVECWPDGSRRPARPLGSVANDAPCPQLALYLDRWEWMLHCPLRLTLGPPGSGETWWDLMPASWIERARQRARGAPAPTEPPCSTSPQDGWLLYADNRAFVWTCAVVKPPASPPSPACPPGLPPAGTTTETVFPPAEPPLLNRVRALGEAAGAELGTSLGYWVRLLNMDPPARSPGESHTCSTFEAAWADERTYRRWAHSGAVQGFNYHGGAMLTGPCSEPPTWRHFGSLYFDQALLLFYLRVTLFRASHELHRLSTRLRRERDRKRPAMQNQLAEEFERLRLDFALFTNFYQFPLLSNQQQGIEMYTLCRAHMDVDDLFREVADEVHSTHDFLGLRAQNQMGELGMILTVVATTGLILTLVLAVLGDETYLMEPILRALNLDIEQPGILPLLIISGFACLFSILATLYSVVHSNRILRLFQHVARVCRSPATLRDHDPED